MRGRIVGEITDNTSSPHRAALPSDSEAALRTELTAQISGVAAQLEAHIEALRHAGDAGAVAQAQSQLQGLSRLEHRLNHASGAKLASLRAEVVASVAVTQGFVSQTRELAVAGRAQEMALHAASAAARETVGSFIDDYYNKRIFEPYLRFGSAEDEEAYRKREAERREAIERELAKGTPAGNLRASELALEQMDDAGRHGADQSPDFAARRERLQQATSQLRDATEASPSQSPAKNTTTPDPLDSIAPAPSSETEQILARFKATGIVVSETEVAAHGVDRDAIGKGGGLRLS